MLSYGKLLDHLITLYVCKYSQVYVAYSSGNYVMIYVLCLVDRRTSISPKFARNTITSNMPPGNATCPRERIHLFSHCSINVENKKLHPNTTSKHAQSHAPKERNMTDYRAQCITYRSPFIWWVPGLALLDGWQASGSDEYWGDCKKREGAGG